MCPCLHGLPELVLLFRYLVMNRIVMLDALGVVECPVATILVLAFDDLEAVSHHLQVELHFLEPSCSFTGVLLRILLCILLSTARNAILLHPIILLRTIPSLLIFHLLTTHYYSIVAATQFDLNFDCCLI